MKGIRSSVTSRLGGLVKNDCSLPLDYDQVTTGPLDSSSVVDVAKWLHPAAFGLTADGS
jgi:hypothetical protein